VLSYAGDHIGWLPWAMDVPSTMMMRTPKGGTVFTAGLVLSRFLLYPSLGVTDMNIVYHGGWVGSINAFWFWLGLSVLSLFRERRLSLRSLGERSLLLSFLRVPIGASVSLFPLSGLLSLS
jgi:hypothetical protein